MRRLQHGRTTHGAPKNCRHQLPIKRVIKELQGSDVMYRTDRDSLGEVRIPQEAYYGPFTARAAKLYRVTGTPAHPNLIRAFVMIKQAAASANVKIGALDAEKGRAISGSCQRILNGEFTDQFIVDAINSGAGTAFNMNTNEVIANVALEIMGKGRGQYDHLHPNDHVNMSQSSNDTFPTAMHVAILFNQKEIMPAIGGLKKSLAEKSVQFASHKKIGRTHLMDALPVTLGGEFGAYASAVEKSMDAIADAQKDLEYVALGATAVGTGANAPAGYRELAVARLAELSGLPLKPEADMQYALQSRQGIVRLSSALRGLAVEMGRIASDIRLMASGPVAGLAEIGIPAVHAGSSIMPGKVNPSLAECMNMICYSIIGNDAAVSQAAQGGQFELNVMLPGMLKCMLESTDMLKNFLPVFASKMISGLDANQARLRARIEDSPVIVTLLAPKLGYLKSAELFKESLRDGKTIRSLVLEKKLLAPQEIDALLES